MFLFRLIGFGFRIIGSLFFVFFLQIQFDGKSLEQYLNHFGKKFIVTKSLQKVSQDGVKVIRSFSPSQKHKFRDPSSEKALEYTKDLFHRVTFPKQEEGTNKKTSDE